jgi:hypothetical protein
VEEGGGGSTKKAKGRKNSTDALGDKDAEGGAEDDGGDGDGDGDNEEGDMHDEVEYKNVDGVYATRDVKRGEVILSETDLPDCALSRSEDPNCEVAEAADGTLLLVARRAIKTGDWLAVAESDDEDEEGDGDMGEWGEEDEDDVSDSEDEEEE